MSEQIREQVSAFLDGELPGPEAELLLKRLTLDVDLRESFGRYALIGECLRGGAGGRLSQGFAARINRAIDREPVPAVAGVTRRRSGAAWWRPLAGVAVAAGVAAVAIVALQQRAIAPSLREGVTASAAVGAGADQAAVGAAQPAALLAAGSAPSGGRSAPPFATLVRNPLPGASREQLSYTTPEAAGDPPAGSPGARLTNYVFVHSNYSWGLGHSNFIDLLADGEAPDPATSASPGAGDANDAGVQAAAATASGADVRQGRGSAMVPARNSRRDP